MTLPLKRAQKASSVSFGAGAVREHVASHHGMWAAPVVPSIGAYLITVNDPGAAAAIARARHNAARTALTRQIRNRRGGRRTREKTDLTRPAVGSSSPTRSF